MPLRSLHQAGCEQLVHVQRKQLLRSQAAIADASEVCGRPFTQKAVMATPANGKRRPAESA